MNNKDVEVVPWSTKEEWKTVYRWLYSQNPNLQQKGLSRISAWKERGCSISPAIDVTAILVRAMMIGQKPVDFFTTSESDELIERAIYSTAITEFISYVSTHACLQYGKMKKNEAIGKMDVPQWLLSLRHQSAHGVRPSLALLKSGAKFALEWIKVNYWEQKTRTMQDVYSHPGAVVSDNGGENLEELRKVFTTFKKRRILLLNSKSKDSAANSRDSEVAINAKISRDGEGCASVLCEDEFLFMDINKLISLARQGGSNASVDKILVDFWSPVFVGFIKYHKTECLLQRLIQPLTSGNVSRVNRAAIWMKLLTKNIKQDDNVDWKTLLKNLLQDPTKNVVDVLECLLEKAPSSSIDEGEKQNILDITRTYLGMETDQEPEGMQADETEKIYTVDDLRVPEIEDTHSCWRLATDIDWCEMPIGSVLMSSKRTLPTDCDMSDLLKYRDIFVPNTDDE